MEPLLPLTIRLREREPRLRELHRQLRSAILDGRLRPGLRLPSTRSLARLNGIARNTAVAAYDLLQSEGYILSKRGSGTCVATTLPQAPERTSTVGRPLKKHRLALPWRGKEIPFKSSVPSDVPFEFSIGVPDVKQFPVDIWRRLSNRVLRSVRTTALARAEPQGRLSFRQAIAQYVSFARAVACSPDDIVVTAGAQQAFELLARVLVTPARTLVAVEDPGYPALRASFAAAGAKISAVPIDREGLQTERLPREARIISVTPSHQFPLGCVLSAARRSRLLEFAHAHGAVVIEDDYDGEFRFADRPLDALQTLDRSESVFYVGTFSKNLLPALRLGYIVAPPWARAALVAAKRMADGECCTLTQDIVSALIREGHLARHVRRMQTQYLQRHRVLLEILRHDFKPLLTPVPSAAGLHVAAVLQRRVDDRRLTALALDAGVGITPLSRFGVRRGAQRGVVFGYGGIKALDIAEALARLRAAWKKFL